MAKKKTRVDTEKIIQEMRERYTAALDAESENREQALDDLKFLAGDQWPDQIRREREADGRPCLQINKLPQFVDQLVGSQRQNRPGIKIRPVDDDADPDTAEMMTGMIRNIENVSDAEIAYDLAFEHAVTCGFGYFRLATEYAGEDTFDQEILIKPITNNFAVHFDISAKNKITMEDAQWCLITHKINKDKFQELYPDQEPTSYESDDNDEWVDGDEIVLAEYFVVETEAKTLYLLPGGETTYDLPSGTAYVRKRTVQAKKIMRYLCTGSTVLEGPSEWPGKHIPIIPVWGKEDNIKGKRILRGIVRHAKDPQRMYNYWRSAATETVALAPRAPFIGTAKQFQGYEIIWDSANRRNIARLPYNPDPMAPGPPNRLSPPSIPTGLANEALQTSDEIKATTGIYDASLGARSNETSGRAITARQRQGDVANFAFIDNLSRALRILGRQLVDLIPKIYDTPRIVRILGHDASEKWVQLYEPYEDPKTGKILIHDLQVGKYDVTVDTGPSFTTRRTEAAETMMEIIRAAPALASVTLDIVADSLDWPNKEKFVERIKKTLPPEMRDGDDDKQPSPEEMQAMKQQQAAMQAQMAAEQAKAQKDLAEIERIRADAAKKLAEIEEIKADTHSKQLENIQKTGIVPPLTGQE